MNFIYSKLEKDIETCFMEFLDSISIEHKLDSKHIKKSWKKFRNKEKISDIVSEIPIVSDFASEIPIVSEIVSEIPIVSDVVSDIPIVSDVVSDIPIVSDVVESTTNKCCYIFIKGKNEGSRCSNSLKNDGKYCTKHLKFENSDKKDKKIIPKLVDNKKLVLMLLEGTPYWWNNETNLVFVSSENKTVIANYRNGILNKLTNDDISECNKNKFVYDLNYNFNLISETQKANTEDLKKSLKNESQKKEQKRPEPYSKNNNILSEEEKLKKLEIYKTNVCAKNIEDVLTNILNNSDDDDYDEEEEENELVDNEEVIDEEDELGDEEDELGDEEHELEDEEEYLDEEM